MSEKQSIENAVANLWALVKHWDYYLAKDAKTDELREAYVGCAKQLKRRLGWLEESLADRNQSDARNETIRILESFMESGWIERFTLVDNRVTIWHSEIGRSEASAFIQLIGDQPALPGDSRIETLESVSSWIANVPAGTSRTSHLIDVPPQL